MRGPLAEVRHQAFLPVRFRAKLQNLLLPQQFHRQSAGNEIGKRVQGSAFEIFGIIVEDKRMARFKKFDELALESRVAGELVIFKVVHLTLKKRVSREKFHHTKGGAANGANVHASVGILRHNFGNLRGAADAGYTLGEGKKHSEFRLFLEAVFHHRAVTRLENMQGEQGAGEKNDV